MYKVLTRRLCNEAMIVKTLVDTYFSAIECRTLTSNKYAIHFGYYLHKINARIYIMRI